MKTLTACSNNEVVVGEDFVVSMDEPGSTGYRYRPLFDLVLLELLSERHSVSEAFADDCRAEFRFRAQATGSCNLCFRLVAPWDPVPSAIRIFQLRIYNIDA